MAIGGRSCAKIVALSAGCSIICVNKNGWCLVRAEAALVQPVHAMNTTQADSIAAKMPLTTLCHVSRRSPQRGVALTRERLHEIWLGRKSGAAHNATLLVHKVLYGTIYHGGT